MTLLYCFYATPPSAWKDSYRSPDVADAIRACASTLAILADRWTEAECVRDVFEILAREVPTTHQASHHQHWQPQRPRRMSDRGRRGIEACWRRLQESVIHRPTLRMVHEMAAEDFPGEDELRDGQQDGGRRITAGSDGGGGGGNLVDGANPGDVSADTNADLPVLDELDLHWIDPSHGPLGDMETEFDHGVGTGLYTANFDLDYG